ncbi:MAG TPA: isovaleryl-CoA dehydrogenase [Xanthobacteraceae bacterium]|jgi:putative acyl-CoA dehydrogenase
MAERVESYKAFNQSPPYEDIDLFASDLPLRDAVAANGAATDTDALGAFGRRWGTGEMFALGRQANEHPPRLVAFDAKGFRRDTIEFHPAYHLFMAESMAARLHASTWRSDATAAPAPAQVARTARFYMAAQVETGHLCPITMTRAAVAALAAEPALAAAMMPRIAGREYDSRFEPWWTKKSATFGMGMTERQGGSDVRANTTSALPAGEGYAISGHKWFMSAPMCDAFMVLAQAPGGLTCFLMPRFRPDGSVNGLRLQRLKDKLGNRSNASAEVEFVDASAWRVGEEGRGVRTIIQMVQLTRLDCAIASAGLMRIALAHSIHHARYRTAFGKRLVEQPIMQRVLADMALDVEAATALVMRLARSFDLAAADPQEAARVRLLTSAAKFWMCKRAPALVCEAMECLGGNGYVEENLLPRLYREAPVNAIWEGSGNIMALDVQRVFAREREPARAVLDVLAAEAGDLPAQCGWVETIENALNSLDAECDTRAAVERLALLAATAALRASAPPRIADLFLRARLPDRHGEFFGTSTISSSDADLILRRALAD